MRLRSFQEYVQGSIQIGLGLGIISLLARWVTGSTILSSPEAMVKYGVFGGIGYALMGTISLLMFSFIGKRVRQDFPNGLTLGDYLFSRLHPAGYWVFIILLIFISLHTLFIQGMIASSLVHFLFDAPVYIGLFFFFSFCVLFAGFGGMKIIHGFAAFQVITIFAAVILIPVYFFVVEGVQPVYDGMRLFHPYMLVINQYELWTFLLVGLLVGFGQFFLDLTSWQRLFMIEPKKIFLTFSLSGLIWFIFPLSFSSLFIMVIFSGGFNGIQSILVGLADKINTPFFFILFVLCAFSAVTSTVGACLHSLVTLLVANVVEPLHHLKNDKQKIKISYLFSIVIGGILYLMTLLFSTSLLELLFFTGNIYSAMIAPIVTIVFSKGKVENFVPISALFGIILGFITMSFLGDQQSIWISALTSFAIIVLCICFKFVKNSYFKKGLL